MIRLVVLAQDPAIWGVCIDKFVTCVKRRRIFGLVGQKDGADVSSHGVDRSRATLATSPESVGLGPAATAAVVWFMVFLPLGREHRVRHDPESGFVL